MNYKKGYLRLTLVLSIISLIIGLIIGINYYRAIYSSYKYIIFKRSLDQNKCIEKAYSEMFNILKNDSNKVKTKEKINHSDFNKKSSLKLRISNYRAPILDYNVKVNLLGTNNFLDSLKMKEISVDKILDLKINNIIPISTKKLIAQQYANDMCPIIEVPYPTQELLFFLVLIPLLSFASIWLLYITIKYVILGFYTKNNWISSIIDKLS